jgi:hypothetical protein
MAHTPQIASDVRPTPSTQPTRRTPQATTTRTAAQHHSRHRAATRRPRASALRGTSPRQGGPAVVVPLHRPEPSSPATEGVHTYAA